MRMLMKFMLWLVVIISSCMHYIHATVTFSNRDANVVLKSSNAKLRVNNAQKIRGWTQESITKDFGNNTSDTWLEAYSNGSIISQFGGTKEPATAFIISNSNSIALLNRTTRTNSNAWTPLMRTTSNGLMALDRTVRTHSNTFALGIRTSSNALLYGIKNNSHALSALDRTTRTNSNAWTPLMRTTSNGLMALDRTVRTHSNTFALGIRTSSNALLLGIKNNSHALSALDRTTRTNSNAWTPLMRTTSNGLMALDRTVRTHSNTFALGIRTSSNALLYGIKNNSHALVANIGQLRTHSNAFVYGLKNNSNAIQYISDHIVFIGSISTSGSTYTLNENVYVSAKNLFHVTGTGDVIIDGNGYFMHFQHEDPNVFIVDPGIRVIFKDIILRDASDVVFGLGEGSSIIFGDKTTLDFVHPETLSRNWRFEGDTIINGYGFPLNFDAFHIDIMQPGTLTLHNVFFNNIKQNNLRCVGDNASLMLYNSTLCLSQDYNFTAGSMTFEREVVITGTSTFTYQTPQASTIADCSTLVFDKGLTFNYAPSIADRDLLVMTNITSELFLKGCTLLSSTAGMRLTNGTLCVDHRNWLYNDGATTLAEGFSLGNGVAANDLNIEMLPGGSLDLKSGYINYANVD